MDQSTEDSTSSMNEQQETYEEYLRQLMTANAASNARIATLERLMGEADKMARGFSDENNKLKADIRTLSQRGGSNSVRVKPQKPESFHGNRSEDVEGFLVTLERYLRLSSVPQDQWVDYAASSLRHQADKWFRVQLTTEGAQSTFATNYNTFKTEFLKQFKPLNAVLTARDKMTKLRQTASAIAYTHRFLDLKLEIPDMSEAESKDRYMRGLKPRVFQKVRVENPNTLNEMIQMAQQFDEAVFNCRQFVGRSYSNPDAMEMDAMDDDDEQESLNAINTKSRSSNGKQKKQFKKKTTDSKMNYNEKIRCMQGGLCFKCRKQGHRIKDCPEWKNLKGQAQ